MRCCCCNRNLSDYESTLKHPVTGTYLDMCKRCIPETGIKPVEPSKVREDEDVFYDPEDDDSVEQEVYDLELEEEDE
jgi:hypothetical protein